MGLLVNEKVLVEMNGYLVVQVSVPGADYNSYTIARGTKTKYSFLYRQGEQKSFKDLTECEAYFSGLLTSELIEKQINSKGSLQVDESVLPLMETIRETFGKISNGS